MQLKFKFNDKVIWTSPFFGEVKGRVIDWDESTNRYLFSYPNRETVNPHYENSNWVEEKELKKA